MRKPLKVTFSGYGSLFRLLDDSTEQEEFAIRIPEDRDVVAHGKAGVERHVDASRCADATEAGVVMLHKEFGLIEPDWLFRVGLIGAAQKVDGLADVARLMGFEAFVGAVIVVNEEHIMSAGRGAAAEVVHGAGREGMLDGFAVVFVE